MMRTIENGALTREHCKEQVTLVGWVAKRRNFGSIVFIDLRDRSGIVQLVINQEELPEVSQVRNEYVLQVCGQVDLRKDPNPKLKTGEVEVIVHELVIVNSAKTPPIIVADETDALEDTRLKYRYLDLRRPVMQQKLMMRSKMVKAMREALDELDFTEVETPMLTRSSPEGAREYLVPSRVHDGQFYALAQSPQIFKQLLMVAGMERYYQVARCFRDEDLRADRQLDFTQFDFEVSFLSEDEILAIGEHVVEKVMGAVGLDVELPLERITYADAMRRFGSDKPDMRFGLELQDISSILAKTEFQGFQNALSSKGSVQCIVAPFGDHLTRKEQDRYIEIAKKAGAKGCVILKVANEELTGSAAKFLSESEKQALMTVLDLHDQDTVFIVADQTKRVYSALNAVRLALRDQFELVNDDDFKYCWVVDFPLFDYDEEESRIVAAHHPFTKPKESDIAKLDSAPLEVISCAYDLVLNGFELVSGSLRIHDQDLQEKVFEVVGFSEQEIKDKFGFFVDALQYGTPPHGGMAFGVDRYAMLLTHSESIRDVIAYPKVASARCLMTDAPAPATSKQLNELHLEIVEGKK